MDPVDVFIDNFLSHAETRYDPVKAHEYYLRNRELKGRRNLSDLKTKGQKEGFQFVSSEVAKEKKAALVDAQESFKKTMQTIQNRRKELSDKLQAISQTTSQASSNSQSIMKIAQAKIDRLPKIPEGIPESRRLKLVAQRKEQIAQIRGDANKAAKSLVESARAKSQTARVSVQTEQEAVRLELKDSVGKARENYKKLRDDIKLKYEAELDKEFGAIRSNVR